MAPDDRDEHGIRHRTVDQVLRFRVVATGEIVCVAGDESSIRALVKLLKGATDRADSRGVPAGSITEGVLADMNDAPSQALRSDGTVLPGFEQAPEKIRYPEPDVPARIAEADEGLPRQADRC